MHTTVAPASPNAAAMPRPAPRVAPATTTTDPVASVMSDTVPEGSDSDGRIVGLTGRNVRVFSDQRSPARRGGER
ncbi:hypothetical protein GCM10023201_16560 [Actinomycetospora corticicola]